MNSIHARLTCTRCGKQVFSTVAQELVKEKPEEFILPEPGYCRIAEDQLAAIHQQHTLALTLEQV